MQKLQRGRDHVVADGRWRVDVRLGPHRASTGPRPRGRGWGSVRALHQGTRGASTGPRPRGRGWVEFEEQLGRSKVASTGPRPRGRGWLKAAAGVTAKYALQRGRDHVVADGAPSAASASPSSRFNGAATTWSRMAGKT